jgi:hypothetical protein
VKALLSASVEGAHSSVKPPCVGFALAIGAPGAEGAVLVGTGAETFTTKVAGARLNVPPLVFVPPVSEMVAVPAPTAVTVRTFVSPQAVNVTVLGETVATEVLFELTEAVNVVLPVRLQPFLPSPFVGSIYSVVVPVELGASASVSAVASIDESRPL